MPLKLRPIYVWDQGRVWIAAVAGLALLGAATVAPNTWSTKALAFIAAALVILGIAGIAAVYYKFDEIIIENAQLEHHWLWRSEHISLSKCRACLVVSVRTAAYGRGRQFAYFDVGDDTVVRIRVEGYDVSRLTQELERSNIPTQNAKGITLGDSEASGQVRELGSDRHKSNVKRQDGYTHS